MKLARPILAVLTVGLVLAVVFTVFGVELASGQSRSHKEITTEVKDRAVLTASLIDSLFTTVGGNRDQYASDYGGSAIPSSSPDDPLVKAAQGAHYAAVVDRAGRVLASAGGYSPGDGPPAAAAVLEQVATQAEKSPTGVSYYIGDLRPYKGGYVADFVVSFQVQGTERSLVTGLDPTSPSFVFFRNELQTVPGVKGEVNYIVDGTGRIIAASNPGLQPGQYPAALVAANPVRLSGEKGGTYVQSAQLKNSTWRVLLAAPDGALFASVNGARAYVPWIIFIALVAVALLAAMLAWRVIRSAELVSEANAKLADVNQELSRANESLHHRAAELARSNEELESFASIASHDLQEPLRKVRTFTEQLSVLEADHLSDKGLDYLGRANAAAERMQKLIEDLLKFSRVSTQARPFEAVDLSEVTRRVVNDLERQTEEAGAVVDVGPLPVIEADPLQMQQLMQNLISNAIKFRRPGVAPEVKVRTEVGEGRLRLTVSDNGIGFEPRYAARIFRIFERLHGRTDYPGTGIGLALCRKIADRHGGTIEADSELGHGATFTVLLPLKQPDGGSGEATTIRPKEEVPAGAAV